MTDEPIRVALFDRGSVCLAKHEVYQRWIIFDPEDNDPEAGIEMLSECCVPPVMPEVW